MRMLMPLTVHSWKREMPKQEGCAGCGGDGLHHNQVRIHLHVSGSGNTNFMKMNVSSFWRFVQPDTIRA